MLQFLIDQKIEPLNFHDIPEMLNNSLTYRLLKELLRNDFIDVNTFCDENYLSRGTFQRRKKKLNKLLANFSLVFSKNEIHGDEKSFRWFFIQLFQNLAQFQLQKDLFTENEWKLFKKCLNRLEKHIDHSLSICFKNWILSCFLSSLTENSQKEFYSDSESFVNFEMRGFALAFHFFSKDKLQFLNLAYYLFYPEKLANLENLFLLHPESIVLSENLDELLPFSLNTEKKQKIASELTTYLNLQEYLPATQPSFFIEKYEKKIDETQELKAKFYSLLQQKLSCMNYFFAPLFKNSTLFRYFFKNLVWKQVFENPLSITFAFYSTLDPCLEYQLKKKIMRHFYQLIEVDTKNSADLKIIHSDYVKRSQAETAYFSSLETEKEWIQFAEQVKKIEYQKLITFLQTKDTIKKLKSDIE